MWKSLLSVFELTFPLQWFHRCFYGHYMFACSLHLSMLHISIYCIYIEHSSCHKHEHLMGALPGLLPVQVKVLNKGDSICRQSGYDPANSCSTSLYFI